jgi:hypothetical protein
MNKYVLTRFISKYNLNGNVSSVVINSKDDILSTRFITGDKSLLGELKLDNWTFEDANLGVYDTEQLSKLLDVLSDDIEIKLKSFDTKAVALEVSDDYAKVNYMLSDLSVINQPPELKQLPEFQVKIKVDTKFITKFIAGKGALPDTDTFTVVTDNDTVKVVIGYSAINTNRVTLPVETETFEDISRVSFNANLFKEVLSANKECESALLEVSEQGLSRISFNIDDYSVVYYLVAVQDID